jgi:hypothetical protein
METSGGFNERPPPPLHSLGVMKYQSELAKRESKRKNFDGFEYSVVGSRRYQILPYLISRLLV